MVEAAAESVESLTERYLEHGDLDPDDIVAGLRAGTLANELVPVLCGSAFKNKGVQAVLDAVIELMPAPTEVKPIKGVLEDGETEATRPSSDDEPFAALAFKIATDAFVGTLTFFRVYSGVIKSGDSIYNPVKHKKERVGRILQMHANSREEIKEVRAGDIAAAVGLKDVTTGDTLCDNRNVITLERMEFPDPVIAVAVRAEDEGGPGEDGHRAHEARRRGPRRSACPRTRNPDRRSSPAWVSCTSISSSTACAASSTSRRTSVSRRSRIARRSARPSRRPRASS